MVRIGRRTIGRHKAAATARAIADATRCSRGPAPPSDYDGYYYTRHSEGGDKPLPVISTNGTHTADSSHCAQLDSTRHAQDIRRHMLNFCAVAREVRC